MPNLSIDVGPDRAPAVELLVTPTEARAESLRIAGLEPRLSTVRVMLDTGAEASLITHRLAEGLGLDPGGETSIFGLAGAEPEAGIVYRIRPFFAGVPAVLLASSAPVLAVADLTRFGVDMIAGRDLLSRCVVIDNGPDGRCIFAF